MRHLFAVIDPQKLQISPQDLARFLGIPQSWILRFEQWAHVLFVHRRDRGGQFISYRQLLHWLKACIQAIHHCSTVQALQELGQLLKADIQRCAYAPDSIAYLRQLWRQHQANLSP
ncbi:hypothetical protein [Leptolyngbya sp. FACHB-261]|uniref:hypothetical protein n=1 Tax=Leptolyngbya sp. FACHB-261 TaxID=2692806 RepID=UPI0016876ADD|nr:hypothetical protein [Leptolyngbya sp. FACHB-261]MBD2101500.1 hypothetical protein [Leptolyngbya sp. FACHB-261]